jgi:cytochrome c oxidase subunit II
LVTDAGLLALFQVQVPGTTEHRVTDIFKPLASPAAAEKDIGWFVIAVTMLIFIVVAGIIVYTIARFRRRPGDDLHQEPAQVYGSNQIELAWTVIPILIVFVLIGVTARVVWSIENASPPPSTLHVKVIGHQWWWEVQYPDYGITTANEIHVPFSPDGKEATYLELTSVDVDHSFWVPQLSGKVDLIPNRLNYMWIDPKQGGVYVGNCAEYCRRSAGVPGLGARTAENAGCRRCECRTDHVRVALLRELPRGQRHQSDRKIRARAIAPGYPLHPRSRRDDEHPGKSEGLD